MILHRFLALLWAPMVMLGVGTTEAGDVAGTVKLSGEAPPAKLLHLTADQDVCGAEPRQPGALLLSRSGA